MNTMLWKHRMEHEEKQEHGYLDTTEKWYFVVQESTTFKLPERRHSKVN